VVELSDGERARIERIARLLHQAERPVRVLRTVAWPRAVRDRFFERGARELPDGIEYQPLDPGPTLEACAQARREIEGDDVVDAWLGRLATVIEGGARMLAAVGTPELHALSCELFGRPADTLADGTSSSLELALELDRVLAGFTRLELGAPPLACHLASALATKMREAVERQFGADAPEVLVVEELSANALAGPSAIRLLRTASFTDRDVHQLIQHEAFVHVATSLNGRAQRALPILGAGHPGTTRTQEGLAVFAELVTGALDHDRLRRLADRVLAVQMSIDGADFLDVYRFFLERTHTREQAFENARRVFRGGVLTGRAPFTKDVVYLAGLLRVHNFLRAVVQSGRTDCMRLLFSGKLDIEDIPALCHLAQAGMCLMPRFLPPWVADLRALVAYLAYSSFLDQVDLGAIREHDLELLAHAPEIAAERQLPGAQHLVGLPDAVPASESTARAAPPSAPSSEERRRQAALPSGAVRRRAQSKQRGRGRRRA
jgi:uncharacterized protein (TIGR02421 family)